MGDRGLNPGPDPLAGELFPGREMKVEWGLERMETALAQLGRPHERYSVLHVGGTNGKGSVASTWASVLQRAGRKTGLYTSPHLCSFQERILVDGQPLGSARLVETANRLRPLTTSLGMSFFEASTLLAFVLLAEEAVDVACVEVGLGGRLDATNVVSPQVTAVTNVAFDHQEYLGDSLAEIAGEKAGIAKPDTPFLTAEARPAALDVLRARAAQVGAPFHAVDPWRDVSGLGLGHDGTRFAVRTEEWGTLELKTPLLGAHQATNAALAVRALELLRRLPSAEAVKAGVASVSWPGRGQIRRVDDRLFVLDVAHNQAGVAALARTLASLAPPRPLVTLAGILGDKDWPRMLPPLVDLADHVVFTVPASAPSERIWDPHAAAERVRDGTSIEVEPSIAAAVDRAVALAAGGTVVVTGSCYTVGDVLTLLEMKPFEEKT